jgi:hypothetical protein
MKPCKPDMLKRIAGHSAHILACRVIADEFGVPIETIRSKRAYGRIPGPASRLPLRGLSYYLACIAFDTRCMYVSFGAGVTRQTILQSLRTIEDRRDDPELDEIVTRLEKKLATLTGGKA